MTNLDRDFEFLNIDATQWTNLLSTIPLFQAEKGIIYLLYQEQEIFHALHSRQGHRPDLAGPFTTPETTTQQLQEKEDVDAVIMFEQALASYLLARVQAAFRPEMDILEYLEIARTSLQEELGRRMHIWPQDYWERSGFTIVQKLRSLIAGLPPNMLGIVVIFEENKIWSSLIFELTEGRVRRLSTTKMLEPWERPITDWQKDYRLILKQLETKMERPSFGFFTDDETFRFLLRSASPLEFIRQARRMEQIIFDPIPSQLRGKL